MIKLSIVIPVYNVAKYLHKGLDSIVNQTYKNLDIVCVNDGSTDDSFKILQEYATNDSRINIIHQENCGTVIARQTAVKATVGDWCIFFDPDDWLDPDTCEKIVDFILCKEDADIIQYSFAVENCDDENQKTGVQDWLTGFRDEVSGSEALLQECFINRNIAWNLIGKCYKMPNVKKAFANQEALSFSYGTDIYATFFLLCLSTKYYRASNDATYHYRWGNGISTKKSLSIETFQKSMNLWDGCKHIKWYGENNHPESVVKSTTIPNAIESIMLDAIMNIALERIDTSIPCEQWVSIVESRTGKNVLNVLQEKYINLRKEKEKISSEYKEWIHSLQIQIDDANKAYIKQEEIISQFQQSKKLLKEKINYIEEKNRRYRRRVNRLICLSVLELIILTIILFLCK